MAKWAKKVLRIILSEPSALQHFSVQDESFSVKHLGLQEDGPNALLSLNTALHI